MDHNQLTLNPCVSCVNHVTKIIASARGGCRQGLSIVLDLYGRQSGGTVPRSYT